MAILVLVFWGEPPYCFPWWLHQFLFPPAVDEGSFAPTTSPTPVTAFLLDDSHLSRSEVVSHCGFELHFLAS